MTHDDNMKFWGIDTNSRVYKLGRKIGDALLRRVRCPTCDKIHDMAPDLTADQVRPLFDPEKWARAGGKPGEEPYVQKD